ncbi:hypothetical protein [Fibrobacter sp.]|uniref:hypothetical protein n=1 Tax=Fibrobacter sp. TaxID=35828 RepID=UPI00386F377B
MATIDKIAEERLVENVIDIMRITKRESRFDLDDLAQDIYISLIEKGEDFLSDLYSRRRELEYFVMRMIANNINSRTSPYYLKYKRFLPQPEEWE